VTARTVWIPPGEWQDVWDGSSISGPKTVTVSQPYERQPMWHRRGGLIITTDKPGLRVDKQDWSSLTLEAFPHFTAGDKDVTERAVHTLGKHYKGARARTGVTMTTDGDADTVSVRVTDAEDKVEREWVFRAHLKPGQAVKSAHLQNDHDSTEEAQALTVKHIHPVNNPGFFPFGGEGSAPAHHAGAVAEVRIPRGHRARTLMLHF